MPLPGRLVLSYHDGPVVRLGVRAQQGCRALVGGQLPFLGIMSDMNAFKYTVAFLLPVKAKGTKNFRELLEYARSMGFQFLISNCMGNSRLLLRAGKVHCTPLEVANLLIALHLLATQRREDLIIVGTIDQAKYQHRLFATLSIAKLRSWSQHLADMLAANRLCEEASLAVAARKHEDRPHEPEQVHATKAQVKKPMRAVVDEPRVLH